MANEIELERLLARVLSQRPVKLVFSNGKGVAAKKLTLLQKTGKRGAYWQLERQTDTQVFHENVLPEELFARLMAFFAQGYRQLDAFSPETELRLRLTKKGEPRLSQNRAVRSASPQPEHNREKNYLLREGAPIPPLVDMGVFTPDGRVVGAMYDKYRQINRFLELIDDAVGDGEGELSVLDFGCGKSYLTFVLYYFLTKVRGIRVRMIGLDLKADVIARCNEAARKYGYEGLRFEVGDIGGFSEEGSMDLVVTLHACDTATDLALANAVRWGARMIFSVPCCQHELNGQIESERLSLLTRYGIVKERTAALLTDAIRADLLTWAGYRTQVLEFVDFAHTPKNLLIRAVKARLPQEKREAARAEAERAMEEFHLDPMLHRLLCEIQKCGRAANGSPADSWRDIPRER